MSSKYLSISTIYTEAQVNIEQFNRILEDKLSWFKEVQETAVKLFGSKTCTLLPKTPSMKRKRPLPKEKAEQSDDITHSKQSTFVDDSQIHKKIKIDLTEINEKSTLDESMNQSSTGYSFRLRNKKKKSSIVKKKNRTIKKTSSYFESPWNDKNSSSPNIIQPINSKPIKIVDSSQNSITQQNIALTNKIKSSYTKATKGINICDVNEKDFLKQKLFEENLAKVDDNQSLTDVSMKNLPTVQFLSSKELSNPPQKELLLSKALLKQPSPSLTGTSFSIVVEKLTPNLASKQINLSKYSDPIKESTPIEKTNESSTIGKNKLFNSVNDQLDAKFDRFGLLDLSPPLSVNGKNHFQSNQSMSPSISPMGSTEDRHSCNSTGVLSSPLLDNGQKTYLVKSSSPIMSSTLSTKFGENQNQASPSLPEQTDIHPEQTDIQPKQTDIQPEQTDSGYCHTQLSNNTQNTHDYTLLTDKEKAETVQNGGCDAYDHDLFKSKNNFTKFFSDDIERRQDNGNMETKEIKKPNNILNDVNSLIKQDPPKEPISFVKIGNIVSAGIKTFMKNQDSPKKETVEEKLQKKQAELKKKDELRQKVMEEQFFKKQKEKEDRKRQREEREKRFAEQIARRQEEEDRKKEQMLLKFKQANQNRDDVRKQKELEEIRKRKQRDIKMAEAEARRQKEEEELRKKAIEVREEDKRREELLKAKLELEELERQRRKMEQEKVEKDRLRQVEEERALDTDRKRREFAERENHRLEVEKKMKEDREKEKIEKLLREEKNKLAEKDIAIGKKHELDRDKLKEKQKEDTKLDIQNEKIKGKGNQFSDQIVINNQNVITKTVQVCLNDVKTLKPSNTLASNKSAKTFKEPPTNWKPPSVPLVVQDTSYISYGLDLDSDDSTDDECEPSKAVPLWAQGINLKRQLMQQFYTDIDPDLIFINAMPILNLEKIFQKRKERYFKRTSSAHWTSPILKNKLV